MRKHCKRKRIYQATTPLEYVLDSIKALPENLLDQLRVRELSAIEAFRTGKAGLQEWTDVNAMLSLSETMGRNGIGPEALPACEIAQVALIRVAKQFESERHMTLKGNELQAMRDLMEFHDLQRQSISRGELESWLRKAQNRLRSRAPEVVDVGEEIDGA